MMAQWVLITGGAKRIGAETAKHLHNLGFNLVIHYNASKNEAIALQEQLNGLRENSVILLQSNLDTSVGVESIINQITSLNVPISILINNASSFVATPLDETDFLQCQKMLTSNLIAPYLLAKACAKSMASNGLIINLLDIHGKRPLKNHGLYSISKAALEMATLSLAQELAPKVRVNGVAPGAIIWPEQSKSDAQDKVLESIPLSRAGNAKQIAEAIGFLVSAEYITGQVITVDGGRSAAGFTGAQ